ncbi:MAG: hypothetical protein K0S47_4010 [Herbinix sp.]|jgi:cytoskeletal protein CcmA (bactofilin family)|nr:hypothetical protein [Herbinix sp.]
MGFFKDLKEDLTQAVNELLPGDNEKQDETLDQMVNTLDMEEQEDTIESTNDDIRELLNEFTKEEGPDEDRNFPQELSLNYDTIQNDIIIDDRKEEEGEVMEDNIDLELLNVLNEDEVDKKEVHTTSVKKTTSVMDDSVTIISKGTTINGSISSDGSLEIMGAVTGDIECLGKLSITGKVVGNSSASEVYVNTERLQGSINSEGSVKVGLGTVIIGDIVGSSGVFAGAIKGEIDINGPVVIDSTAIIKGNIKAKSVQINNGAVIEGFYSLSYASVDLDNIFE